ncbi:prephenate dehydrogenase/arogenate dehydrogenase family protein, partial [SAR202 cluster bacterium AD-802-E10_MRT_200m]|nr:prephenate dehydrogenase/arogenate dehydrogenase family protein [SAR202 cluster bacterium AD-802-E10_MRT_200m]
VGGHPMAGRESSGPEAAEATLFDGATYAICATPSAESQAVQTNNADILHEVRRTRNP